MWGRGGFLERQIRPRDDLPRKFTRATPLICRKYYPSQRSQGCHSGFRLNYFRYIVRVNLSSQLIINELDYQLFQHGRRELRISDVSDSYTWLFGYSKVYERVPLR